MKKQLSIGLAATLGVLGVSVFAGDEPGAEKAQMFCIYKEIVKPSKTQQYENAVKYMINEFKEYQVDPAKVNWFTVTGPELGYIYVMPIDGWSGMDTMQTAWKEAIDAIGKEKFEDMTAPMSEAMESIEIFHSILREDLSYRPENPRLSQDEIGYAHYGFYYGIPGKSDELEEIAKGFAELYREAGIDTGFDIYQPVTGADLPYIIVAQVAKSEADYFANRERIREILGEKAKKLAEKVGATVRKIEYKSGTPRPDLSYPTPDMMGAGHDEHDHDH